MRIDRSDFIFVPMFIGGSLFPLWINREDKPSWSTADLPHFWTVDCQIGECFHRAASFDLEQAMIDMHQTIERNYNIHYTQPRLEAHAR